MSDLFDWTLQAWIDGRPTTLPRFGFSAENMAKTIELSREQNPELSLSFYFNEDV